jgi:putative ABC transport system permease protein
MPEGMTLPPNQSAPVGPLIFVSDRYFATLGAPLVRGRFFTARDDRTAPEVVIINEALAKRYFGGQDPVGRRLKNGGPERPIGPNNQWMTIVGVVGDIYYSGLDAPADPTVYMPLLQRANTTQYVVLRTASDPGRVASSARSIVAELDKDLPIVGLMTMAEQMRASVGPSRFRTTLVAIFAAIGLLLAAIGIYGVMAYTVSERTHEIGVRAALGAERRDVLKLVLGEAAGLAAAGVAAGLAGSLATTRLIRALLFHVEPTDPATLAGISVLFAVTALVASYVPARRAMRVDPMIALRYE